MQQLGIDTAKVHCYIPPYEWWNDTIAKWSENIGLQIVCFTPGTGSNADYTYPQMGASYKSSEAILKSVKAFEKNRPGKLNGVILLIHAGTDARRKDKFYLQLNALINYLKQQGYRFKKVDELVI
jgi:peptidoglycan/xylan/chitin deacetylase (PgdA/CDA1 family)